MVKAVLHGIALAGKNTGTLPALISQLSDMGLGLICPDSPPARDSEFFFPMEYMSVLFPLRILYSLFRHETSCDASCRTGG